MSTPIRRISVHGLAMVRCDRVLRLGGHRLLGILLETSRVPLNLFRQLLNLVRLGGDIQ